MPDPKALAELVHALDWPGEVPDDGASADERAALAARLGEGPARWVRGAVQSSLDTLAARADADRLAPVPQVRALAEHVLGSIVVALATAEADTAERTVDRLIAHDIVARGIGLPQVIDAMRTFQNRWLVLLIERAMIDRRGAAIAEFADVVTRTIDAWVDTFIDAVLTERERTYQSQQLRVRSTIEALVTARAYDEAAAADLLGTPLDGWHVGVVLGAPTGAIIEQRAVEAVVSSLARSAGVTTPLRYDTSGGIVWLWVGSERPLEAPRIDDLRVPAPLVVGIGRPHPGAAGFRRTHLEALDALRTCGAGPGAAYPEVALASVLSADDERARWFVDVALGEIAADSPEMADLRDTLRVFYATRMRIAPAADLLFVHRNTLISRLERIERVLGHSVADRTAETQAALVLHDLLAAR